MIDLYALTSPNVQKVYIMLEECALPYKEHFVDVWKGDQYGPEFSKINPNNKIPAIVDHDGPGGNPYTVIESGAILLYLAEKTGKFLPKDMAKKYDVVQWLMKNTFRRPHHDTHPDAPKARDLMTMANLPAIRAEVTRYFGAVPLWLTEYGYQTNPPDNAFGVSWAKQAQYLTESYAIARKNPRIDMFLWFLIKDEPNIGGWQSGLETITGRKKPAWNTFVSLPRG